MFFLKYTRGTVPTLVGNPILSLIVAVKVLLLVEDTFGLSAAIIFLCVQINRLIAKEIFQRFYYREELFMPTTTHILLSNNFYDGAIKSKIRNKIQDKFDITLPGVQEEQHDTDRTRKIIAAAVSQIRIALKSNAMLLQHNIEYGFWCNLIGGCFSGCIFNTNLFFW